ncbi:TetR family transcriptional regulator [Sphingomonas lycopersici]|uniref:TetR family transcriptional regulator n=1 Tax=Sphingomonas lycopersici TaxID=2951807 RepID=A0AA41Z505_9SPHN|nr:TetR family transcriptional regulator [Sphingomonas lycopersici]MCW6534157.1 TetR family transcriptional regulator [Sphingomonas lycopersici]
MASNQAEHILSTAARLALDHGLGALTMRAVASAAGVSSSAIVYHFQTREGLLVAILEYLAESIAAGRDRLAGAFDDEQRAVAGPAAGVAAILCRMVDEQGLASITVSEIARLLRGTEMDQAVQAAMAGANQRAAHFWQALPLLAQEDSQAREIWAAFGQGVLALAMLDRSPVARNARVIRLTARLADRLAGREVVVLPASDAPQPLAALVRPAGKQQIVDATIRLSGEGGIEALTHRKIAAAAGLSVASTTYFYPTKEDIIVDAAYDVQARAMNAVINQSVAPPSFMSRITLDDRQEERAEMATLSAFMAAAVRNPELLPLAEVLRRTRGIDGARWLAARGYHATDRLDGIVWAAVTSFLAQHALLLPAAERVAFLDDFSDAWLRRLFG